MLDLRDLVSHSHAMTDKDDATILEDFILNRMRMSHIYQPVMLKALLEGGGAASLEDIAKALLSYDLPQIEYYGLRTKRMVGNVLTKNGIVEPIKSGSAIVGYRLVVDGLSGPQRADLSALCGKRLDDFIQRRGSTVWGHRSPSAGYVSGSARYEVLKRAKHRCELCGAHETQAALHVDHIVPRSKGGSDDLSNFQALCVSCNTSKRDRDATDFRQVVASYQERQAGCIFCDVGARRVIADNELCFAIRDGFPVTPLHTLVIPKRHVADYFDLYRPERNAIEDMLHIQRASILEEDPVVTGFNIGINAGRSAGQTVSHVHVHLIPRREGDVEEPRGGVRGVIPGKQRY
ncbi:MAG: HIT domain-containing protein [Roseicyclus sp.]|uniref:HIT domain-containing protein n=1 Tax=Roseicyclus sp. TaxID=1914329 RepID=UPI003A844FD2